MSDKDINRDPQKCEPLCARLVRILQASGLKILKCISRRKMLEDVFGAMTNKLVTESMI